MFPFEEVLEVVPTPGRYGMFAFIFLGITVIIIFYFMKRSLRKTRQHFEEN
jgi:preprotein translocase subunit YajC